jgi:cellulose synthase operon protein C
VNSARNRDVIQWQHPLIGAGLALAGTLVAPAFGHAEPAGVKALVDQARYWEGKGRHDLAQQAWHRVQDLDPGNAAAKAALSPAPSSAPAPAAAHAPVVAKAKPAARATHVAKRPRPEPHREASAEAPKPEKPRAEKPAPAPKLSSADAAGQARLAGFTALKDNDVDAAQRDFQAALSRNKRDGDALGGMGLVYMKRGRFAEARDALAQAGQLGDASKWKEALASATYFASLQDAQAMVARGQLDSAQHAAEALIRSGYSQSGAALELLADIYERQGRYADAADLYRQAGEGNSPNGTRLQSRAARGAALAAAARGDDFTAEQAFQQGMMLDPSDPWIRYEFARFMIRRGRVPESESIIGSLAASSNPDAVYAAAMLDADLGRGQAAQGLIDRIPNEERSAPMRSFAIGLKVDNAVARARVIAAAGQRNDAVATLRALGQTQGLAPTKQAAIADALSDMGDQAGAASMAQQALSGQVTDLAAYEGILRIAARTGRDDLARTAMARATQLAGNTPDGRRSLGRMAASAAAIQADRLRTQGQYAQAFDVLQAAYPGAPDNLDLLSSLARLYQSGRMNARAAQTFQIILTHDARNRDALSGLMETAQAAGDKALSERAESELLRAYPANYESYLAAARTEQARGNTGTATRYYKQAKEVYTRSAGASAGAGNPFATSPFAPGAGPGTVAQAGSNNPFRNQPQGPAAQATPNPFALGNGTRLAAPSAGPAYVQPQSSYQQPEQPYPQVPGTYTAQQAAYSHVQPATYTVPQGQSGNPLMHMASFTQSQPALEPQPVAYDAAQGDYGQGYPAQQGAYQPSGAPAQTYPAQQGTYQPSGAPAQTYPAQQGAYQPSGAYGQTYPAQQGTYQPSGAYAQTYPVQQDSYQPTGAYGQTYPVQQGNYAATPADLPQPAFGYGTPTQPTSTTWGGMPGTVQADSGAVGNQTFNSADPVLAGIEKDIAGIQQSNGPRAEVHTDFRSRAGETGLSALDEIKADAELSTGLGHGRVYARAETVTIDAGRPTGSALQRFGTNATIEAESIVNAVAAQLVNAETQRASGVAVSGGYADKLIQIEGGTTPIGMGQTKAVWHAEVTPKLGDNSQARAWFERKPVTDSIVSYAGTRDPVTGLTWGQVMRMGGGAGYSYDKDGNGVYATAAYNTYRGDNVLDNHNVEVNVGGYLKAWGNAHSQITAGINVNYQKYQNNQNEFTYGLGGYFSPQSFLALAFPVNYHYQKGKFEAKAGVTPGFQTFSQDQTNLYPTDAARQAELDALKALDGDVRNYYDSLSKTGFGISASGSLYYAVSPATRVGGEASYNTFGSYNEFRALLGIRQALGSTK